MRIPGLALLVSLVLLAACGEDSKPITHPAELVGRYAATADQFVDEVRELMRYDLVATRGELGTDRESADLLVRLEEASRHWARALENELVLEAGGSVRWRVLEPMGGAGRRVVLLLDLEAPGVLADYEGTWWQEDPGKVHVTFERRNGEALRYPQTSVLTVRDDGALLVPWMRDHEISIEEAPLLRR